MFETRGVTIPAQDPDRESYFKLLDDSGSSFGSSKKQNCNTNRSVMVVGLDPKLKSDFQPLGNSGSGSSKSGLVTPLLVTTNACSTDSAAILYSTVEFVEREWKFRLGSEFTTTFGRNLGDSDQTCRMLSPNALRCEERHSEHKHWHVLTTFEFYQLGILRIVNG